MPKRILTSSALLLVFPTVFLFLQILLKIDYRYFFLSSHDPSYGYLFNGLDLASGSIRLGLFAHPGAPLHLLVAVNLWIFRIFSPPGTFPAAVMSNPEFYLQVISLELVLMITLAMFFMGRAVIRKTKNLPLALALQLTPFLSAQGFIFDSFVMVEPILLLTEIGLLVLMTNYVFGRDKRLSEKSLIAAGALSGLGLAGKIVYLPVVLLPYFALRGVRRKLTYTGLLIIFLALFMIPVYGVFPYFLVWVRGLFMHTGLYGSGPEGIVNYTELVKNLGKIFQSNLGFTVGFIVLLGISVGSFIRRPAEAVLVRLRVIRGLTCVMLINILMVAKHFSEHYLIISYNLVLFGWILVISLLSIVLSEKNRLRRAEVQAGIVGLTGLFLLTGLVHAIHFSPGLINPRLKSLAFVKDTVQDTPRMIVLEHPGPFRETALYHGLSFSGAMKRVYAPILQKMYPMTCFYNPGTDQINGWITGENLANWLSLHSRSYVYYLSRTDTFPERLAAGLAMLKSRGFPFSLHRQFYNPATSEYFYQIISDTAAMRKHISRQIVARCDFERISPHRRFFLGSDTTRVFQTGSLQSDDQSRSGRHSIKLTPEQSYGAKTMITLEPGYVEIGVWRRSDDGEGLIVASGPGGFYQASEVANEVRGGWGYVRLLFNVPQSMVNQTISVYLWYPGKGTCYFDDLEVIRYDVH